MPSRKTALGSRQRHRAAYVVEQDFRKLAVAQCAEGFAYAGRAIGRGRSGKAERTIPVGQVFGIIELARGAGEREHEGIRRKRDDVVGRLVIVEIIVIVLHEEDRRRA